MNFVRSKGQLVRQWGRPREDSKTLDSDLAAMVTRTPFTANRQPDYERWRLLYGFASEKARHLD
jgi:hypothetical protein